jgi:hypothetical protein
MLVASTKRAGKPAGIDAHKVTSAGLIVRP